LPLWRCRTATARRMLDDDDEGTSPCRGSGAGRRRLARPHAQRPAPSRIGHAKRKPYRRCSTPGTDASPAPAAAAGPDTEGFVHCGGPARCFGVLLGDEGSLVRHKNSPLSAQGNHPSIPFRERRAGRSLMDSVSFRNYRGQVRFCVVSPLFRLKVAVPTVRSTVCYVASQ
jgi:hypothetical protein